MTSLPDNGVYKIYNVGTSKYLAADNSAKMVVTTAPDFKVCTDSIGIFAISYDVSQWNLKDQIQRGAFEDIVTLQLRTIPTSSTVILYGFFAPKEESCVVFVSLRG